MPSDTIAQLILPKELIFLSTRTFRNGFLWEVQKKRVDPQYCPKCAHPSSTRCGRASTLVREAPLQNKALWLKIHKHRYFCKSCRKSFTETVEGIWPKQRTTKHFRKTLAQACENFHNLSLVQEKFKVSSGFCYQIHYRQLEIKLRERKNLGWPKKLGIDEHFFTRSQGYTEFATVLTDLGKRRLFEMVRGKDVRSLLEQLKDIPGRENVEVVVMDLCSTFKSFVRQFFPNAKIVADKFHVIRQPFGALIQLRRQLYGHRQALNVRRLLLKNREDLDYFKQVDLKVMLEPHPELKELYEWKERLRRVYRCRGIQRAEQSLNQMLEQMKASTLSAVQKLRRTLLRWKQEILEYFVTGLTNALTESMNKTAKLIQRRAHGFRSFKNYRLKTLNACYF
jgi:transposase